MWTGTVLPAESAPGPKLMIVDSTPSTTASGVVNVPAGTVRYLP
jgi:hypothetical protein